MTGATPKKEKKKKTTEIKKWMDDATDTLWEICPFCKAYVKDLSYEGHGISKADSLGPGIHSHIAAEHGMKRVRIGKRQKWIHVPPESGYYAWAKKEEESRLRIWGKDSIRRYD
jgi:hypothetical protein